MIVPARDSQIVCVWYPSGGFGHFVGAVLSLYGANFVRVQDHIDFSITGDSHSFPLVLPKYLHNPKDYSLKELKAGSRYIVLIDNGINDESTRYQRFFPDAAVIKICYDDLTWPIVARTMIKKALRTELDRELHLDSHAWPSSDNWAVREKYFLFLRDHPLRHRWRVADNCYNLNLHQLLRYDTALEFLKAFAVADSFDYDWLRWAKANDIYIKPVETAKAVVFDQHCDQNIADLSIWEQAVINYYVWLRYNIEIPANNFADWFDDTAHLYRTIHNLKKD